MIKLVLREIEKRYARTALKEMIFNGRKRIRMGEKEMD